MRADPVYDRIGTGYAIRRREDSRWAAHIRAALGAAHTIVNVGAGAGSYEPAQARVVAVEPSSRMIAQRTSDAPVVRALAESLPFADRAFDAALAILTVHHWRDPLRGLCEMQRIACRQVVVTWDPRVFAERFWFVRDYLPEAAARERGLATLELVVEQLGGEVHALPVSADCSDGFFGAYWRRPEAYLDFEVRRAISGLALLEPTCVARALARLREDLEQRTWHARYAHLLEEDSIDLGYRIVIGAR